ncbi:MAG TPA: type II secretion system protein [Pyrinomonadaceae bacterium]|jgi:prepilin-type N-terminal cleavage/methylation domain-containing protein
MFTDNLLEIQPARGCSSVRMSELWAILHSDGRCWSRDFQKKLINAEDYMLERKLPKMLMMLCGSQPDETNTAMTMLKTRNRKTKQSGFSLIEMLMVIVIGFILATVSIFYLAGHKKLYKAEDQALQIIDVLQDAKQLALNERQTMRVEINTTKNAILIIDENKAGDSDDKIIKQVTLANSNEATVGPRPANISAEPGEPLPVPRPTFAPSSHPLTQGNSVAVLRFTSTGLVLNAGTNSVGAGSTMTGMTIYVWKPQTTSPTNSELTRGITVLGASGTIRMWNYTHAVASPSWQNR